MTPFVLLIIFMIFFFMFRMNVTVMFMIVIFFVALIRSGVFIVNEGEQVVLTQFGKIVMKPYKQPGLYFKIPIIWKANYFDKRIFTENEFRIRSVTQDEYFIYLDTVVNWRISDPELFFIRLKGSSDEVRILLRNIISGMIRDSIGRTDLVGVIRSKRLHSVFDSIMISRKLNNNIDIMAMHKKVKGGRPLLIKKVKQGVTDYLAQSGIAVLGIYVKDITYDPSVEKLVFKRMIAKRLIQADKLRSNGLNIKNQIEGKLNLAKKNIIAPAIKKALIIKGKADATATRIYAQVYQKDKEFYNYWRRLKAYKNSIPSNSEGFILSTDLDFFNALQNKKSSNIKIPLRDEIK